MYKICHVDLLQQTFEDFDLLVKEHFSLFPKQDEVIKKEECVETILDGILRELSDMLRRKTMPQNEFEVFKISSYVLKLSQAELPPTSRIRTKLLEILSLCYEYNSGANENPTFKTNIKKDIRDELHSFNMESLEKIRTACSNKNYGKNLSCFLDELETIIKDRSYDENNKKWHRMKNDSIVRGDVWQQEIGNVYYNQTVHQFAYLYVKSSGLAIARHGHNKFTRNGMQIIKTKEWYVFPDGKMSFCDKDMTHKLVNNYGKPIYVLSIKLSSKG